MQDDKLEKVSHNSRLAPTNSSTSGQGFSRRTFLKTIGGVSAGTVVTGMGLSGALLAPGEALAEDFGSLRPKRRRIKAFKIRRDAALSHFKDIKPQQPCNRDEQRYDDYRASFFKTLPQNDLGEVEPRAYGDLLSALESGRSKDFEAIELAPGHVFKLGNPQASYSYDMTSVDSHNTRIAPSPAFGSAETAAEMGEVYWQALTRDVPFVDYGSDQTIWDAVTDLNTFSETVGPKDKGDVTPDTIFRGESQGDLIGPYLSQFLWKPIRYGMAFIEQKYLLPLSVQLAESDFMTDYDEWLAIQRGASPENPGDYFDSTAGYIHTNRGLAEYVHKDVLFQAYFNAVLIIDGFGADALAPNNPYLESSTQSGFSTFGMPDIVDLVAKAANVSLKGAWYQKWLIHRRLRPEVFAARIENQLNHPQKNYGIHPDIFDSAALDLIFDNSNNYLLPVAYPEGSPIHPSYPAGHATIAGACSTILKAFFREDFVIPDPVEASSDGKILNSLNGTDLLLGDEINKLAANITLGRDAAGIHYRSDGIQGISAGAGPERL